MDHERSDGTPGLVSVLGVKYTMARALAQEAVDLSCRKLGKPAGPCRTTSTPLEIFPPGEAATGDLPRPRDPSLDTRIRQAVHREMAVKLSDLVFRRLELGSAACPSVDRLTVVSEKMGNELGWSRDRRFREVREVVETYHPLSPCPVRSGSTGAEA
jgi:glycerol-3-phosphate dehydrogenase